MGGQDVSDELVTAAPQLSKTALLPAKGLARAQGEFLHTPRRGEGFFWQAPSLGAASGIFPSAQRNGRELGEQLSSPPTTLGGGGELCLTASAAPSGSSYLGCPHRRGSSPCHHCCGDSTTSPCCHGVVGGCPSKRV